VVAVNAAFGSLFAVDPQHVRGIPLTDLLAPDDGEALAGRIGGLVRDDGGSLADLTLVGTGESDTRVVEWELAPVRDQQGGTIWLFCVLREITADPSRAGLGRSSDQDPITGLPNREHLLNRLERSLERTVQAASYAFAVIGLDVDGLRAVQRRLGTAVGNALLEALVWRVRQCLRPGDLIARVGSDRLVVLLDHFALEGRAEEVLRRIDRVSMDPYLICGERIGLRTVGASSPVRAGDRGAGTAGELLDALESAVTRARLDVSRA
jgi:diguanylate cyclase (GGDEF)-like protein